MLVDGVDLLDDVDGAPDLTWLPPSLPPSLRAARPATGCGRSTASLARGWACSRCRRSTRPSGGRVTDVPRPLREGARRRPRRRAAAAAATGNALFLRTVLDELRQHGDHFTLGEVIAPTLGADLDDLMGSCSTATSATSSATGPGSSATRCGACGPPASGSPRPSCSTCSARGGRPTRGLVAALPRRRGGTRHPAGRLIFATEPHRRAVESRYLADRRDRRAAHAALAGTSPPIRSAPGWSTSCRGSNSPPATSTRWCDDHRHRVHASSPIAPPHRSAQVSGRVPKPLDIASSTATGRSSTTRRATRRPRGRLRASSPTPATPTEAAQAAPVPGRPLPAWLGGADDESPRDGCPRPREPRRGAVGQGDLAGGADSAAGSDQPQPRRATTSSCCRPRRQPRPRAGAIVATSTAHCRCSPRRRRSAGAPATRTACSRASATDRSCSGSGVTSDGALALMAEQEQLCRSIGDTTGVARHVAAQRCRAERPSDILTEALVAVRRLSTWRAELGDLKGVAEASINEVNTLRQLGPPRRGCSARGAGRDVDPPARATSRCWPVSSTCGPRCRGRRGPMGGRRRLATEAVLTARSAGARTALRCRSALLGTARRELGDLAGARLAHDEEESVAAAIGDTGALATARFVNLASVDIVGRRPAGRSGVTPLPSRCCGRSACHMTLVPLLQQPLAGARPPRQHRGRDRRSRSQEVASGRARSGRSTRAATSAHQGRRD